MTGNEIFKLSLAAMASLDAREDYELYAIPGLNTVIAEAFLINNIYRLHNGKDRMATIPVIVDLENDIDYEYEVCAQGLPYGLAAYLYLQDEGQIASWFNSKWEEFKTSKSYVQMKREE